MRLASVEAASEAIDGVEKSALAYGTAVAHEMKLADERCIAKRDAVRRIMATENEETKKPHSASSAEKIVETDAEYMAYRDSERAAVIDKEVARGRFEAAKLRARLEVELAAEGVRAI